MTANPPASTSPEPEPLNLRVIKVDPAARIGAIQRRRNKERNHDLDENEIDLTSNGEILIPLTTRTKNSPYYCARYVKFDELAKFPNGNYELGIRENIRRKTRCFVLILRPST